MLKRKLLRDLWQNRTQFISIFLMAFLGLFVFAGIDAESTGIGISTAQYYEETNLADNWVMGTSFSTEEVKRLEALPQIASVDRKLVLEALGKVPLLTAGLHLGEGTGAVASIPLWDMALAVYRDCYSFTEGGITPYTPQC